MGNLAPMMQHYVDMKKKYEFAILFYRVGDFYEMFFEDALEASKLLDLNLTSKACGNGEKAPMCGVPHHSAEQYVRKLVSLGKKVAICEQTDDEEKTGIIKRDVVRIITPGTILDDVLLNVSGNNYIACLLSDGTNSNDLSFADISTGQVFTFSPQDEEIADMVLNRQPKEIILNQMILKKIKNNLIINSDLIKNFINSNNISVNITDDINVDEFLSKFPLNQAVNQSLIFIYAYIYFTQKTFEYAYFHKKNQARHMKLDHSTLKNLEVTQSIREQAGGSLFKVLNKTSTAMGARFLKNSLIAPLYDKSEIEARLACVEALSSNVIALKTLKSHLGEIYDLERIANRIVYNTVKKIDLIKLKKSLNNIAPIKELLLKYKNFTVEKLFEILDYDTAKELFEYLDDSIDDDFDSNMLIKSSFNEELAHYRKLINNSADMLIEIENKEKQRTGAKQLKIGYNKIFGYYIEISKSQLQNITIPEDYIRKQTLVSAERFISEDLKNIEQEILEAKEKQISLENALYNNILERLKTYANKITALADGVAFIDFLAGLAVIAKQNNYKKPVISEESNLLIKNGRHPVIEKIMEDEIFISNDTNLKEGQCHIITGPNMAGKSTYMRQIALIVIMAHIGSFVPADYAVIPLTDAVMTRIGASDDLSSGRSTFMVEMIEVSNIVKTATSKSLILLDELGRGTSTYDGMSLAYSIIEYISQKIRALTLVSTHYHELTVLEKKYDNIKNYCMLIDDTAQIRFLRKVVEGKADRSYGIHVAQLAGLPNEILNNADIILKKLETKNSKSKNKLDQKEEDRIKQLSIEKINQTNNNIIIKMIKEANIDEFSPEDALDFLHILRKKIK